MGVRKYRSQRNGRFWKAVIIAGSLVLMLASSLAGCSSSSKDTASSAAQSNGVAKNSSGLEAKDQSGNTESAKASVQGTAAGATNSAPAAQDKAASASASSVPLTVTPAIGSDGSEGFNRKLIYKANLVMPVKDYAAAQTQLRDLVALSGAYILQFSENTNTGEKGGNFTIKVGANGFVSLLDGLEKISPSLQRNVQGQDVTEEYVDLSSRLKAKQVVETRLLAFMDKASKTDDLLAFSAELSKVQEEIEQIKGRMRYLDQNVSYSTVELRMYQQTGSKSPFDPNKGPMLSDRLQKALNSSLNVLAAVLQGILVFLAAALPVLLLAAIILVPFYVYRRRRNQRLAETRNQVRQQNSAVTSLMDLSEPKDE
jgi:hypothetical protein